MLPSPHADPPTVACDAAAFQGFTSPVHEIGYGRRKFPDGAFIPNGEASRRRGSRCRRMPGCFLFGTHGVTTLVMLVKLAEKKAGQGKLQWPSRVEERRRCGVKNHGHQGEIISLIERILSSRARVSLPVIERLFANKTFRKIFSFEKNSKVQSSKDHFS